MRTKTHTRLLKVLTGPQTDKERTKKKRFNFELLPNELNNCFQKSINSCFLNKKRKDYLFPARVPLVKYPSNKVNSREKVISAQRAKDNWPCEEQFRATLAALVLKQKILAADVAAILGASSFGNFVRIFIIFIMQQFPEACVMNALIVLALS